MRPNPGIDGSTRALRALWLGGLLLGLSTSAGLWLLGGDQPVAIRLLLTLSPLWAALALTLLTFGIEMVAVAVQHRDDPAPRPTAAALLRAALRESWLATRVFGWRQVWRSRAYDDRCGAGSTHRTGVLLVHGYHCNRGFWWPEWPAWLAARGIPHVAVDLVPMWTGIDSYAPQVEAAVARLIAVTGRPSLIVAHSMGGLAVRAWWRWRQTAGLPAIAMPRVLTLGTPHRGTWLSRMSGGFSPPNARQMLPDSPWLQALAASESPAWRARFICVHSHCDNVVFPPARAVLDGAAEVQHWPGLAHLELSRDGRVWPLVAQMLEEAGERCGP